MKGTVEPPSRSETAASTCQGFAASSAARVSMMAVMGCSDSVSARASVLADGGGLGKGCEKVTRRAPPNPHDEPAAPFSHREKVVAERPDEGGHHRDFVRESD